MLVELLAKTATTEEVFKSIGDSLDAQINPNHVILLVIGLVGVIALVAFLTRTTEKKDAPKVVNNPGKLTRQLARQLGLKPNELRQLKQLAEQEGIDNPLVLLLCPSALQAAMKKRQQAKR
jgi:hypothetical protein